MERVMVRCFLHVRRRSFFQGSISPITYPKSIFSSFLNAEGSQSNICTPISRTITSTVVHSPTPYEFQPSINTYSTSTTLRLFSSKSSLKSDSKKLSKDSSVSTKAEPKKLETIKIQQQEDKPIKSEDLKSPTLESSSEIADKTSDPCPPWQNPLHHNDVTLDKIMLEEYRNGDTPNFVPLPPFDDGSGKIVVAPHLDRLADEIVNMSMLEVKDLTDRLAEHFGIEEEEDDDDMGLVGNVEESKPAVEEKKEEKKAFDVKLVSYDEKSKIKVIKEIRAITNLGLKEAKDLVEGVPKVVKKDVKKEEADELKEKLVAAGATVEIV